MFRSLRNSSLELVQIYQFKFGLRVLLWIVLTLLCFLAPIFLPFLLLPIISLFFGLIIAHGVELQHQAIHYTGFKNRFLNVISGNLLGLPTLNSFTHYQTLHNWHHQKIGTEDDVEFFNTHRINDRISPFKFILLLLRINDTIRLIYSRLLFKIILPKNILYFNENKIPKIEKELALYRSIYFIFFISIIAGATSYKLLVNWILALLFYHIWHFLFEFPEHYFCHSQIKSIYYNTRSITGNTISRYITNFNNFHVEHHLYPKLPMDYLIFIHNETSPKIKYKNVSYLEFYINFFRRIK